MYTTTLTRVCNVRSRFFVNTLVKFLINGLTIVRSASKIKKLKTENKKNIRN